MTSPEPVTGGGLCLLCISERVIVFCCCAVAQLATKRHIELRNKTDFELEYLTLKRERQQEEEEEEEEKVVL
jgi:hypothetical protein